MRVAYSIQLQAQCSGCATLVALNGTPDAFTCYACGKALAIDESSLRELFDPDNFRPYDLEPGRVAYEQLFSAPVNMRLTYAKEPPLCNACSAPLDGDALAAALAAGSIACARCGRGNRVRAPDARARVIDAHAVLVVGETAHAVVRVDTPVVFACMKCSAPLDVDGRARTIACPYCRASNYLPDGVWQILYPAPPLQAFYVVCEYDGAAAHAVRWRDERAKLRDAREAALAPELFAELASDEDDDVRAAVAKNPAAPPDMLARLATDEDDDVREVAVAHPQLPSDTLRRVAIDEEDRGVIDALWKRADLPAEIVEELARSKDHYKRRRAAEHANLPVAWLAKLERDDDRGVVSAALERIKALRAQGIDVPGRGFFRKLFG